MVELSKENFIFSKKLKLYVKLILIFILIQLIIINSIKAKRTLKKQILEENNFFDNILKVRKLEENHNENISSTNCDKICSNADEELFEYYITGNLENIEDFDNYMTYENKDKPYFKALINIINYYIFNDTKNEDIESSTNIKDDIITYSKHVIPILIFLVIGVLTIPFWLVCLICCCCNCCCCCCFKKPECKFRCFIITFVLYMISIAACIYGFIKSDSIVIGISNTECSILKFYEQILEGETKQTLPKWAGIKKISQILMNIKDEIKDLRKNELNELNQELDNIRNKKISFKNKMKESGNAFYSSSDGTTYIDLYSSDEYNINSRGITGRYVLDLVKIFGRKVDIDEEKYEPKNSILDTWHNEYNLISKNADIYLEETLNDLTTISNNNNVDIVKSLEQGIENINKYKDFFDKIKKGNNTQLIDILVKFDEYGKIALYSFFGLTASIILILGLLIFCLCLCSGKICADCCIIRCIIKISIYIFLNILYLSMIISFIIGFAFAFFGTIANDYVSVISFLVSEENLGEGGENLIIDQLGLNKNYLNVCINGDGRIDRLFNINNNQNKSLNKLLKNEEQINIIKTEFEKRKNFTTYSYYVNQLKGRDNLEIIPMLIKDSYDINLPLNVDHYYGNHPDKYLKFDIELEALNTLIRTQETGPNKNEQWKINSYSLNECGSGDDPIYYYSSEFNPLKCKPMNREWIQTTSNNGIKAEAKIVSDFLTFLENANNKNENIYNSENPSFINILNDLKRVYNEYLDQYIITLDSFNNTLNKITGKLSQYINNDDNIFSFMNGKIIGTNLKIMLKYLKTDIGNNTKIFGICLIILGCSLLLSISFTILLKIIIEIDFGNQKSLEFNKTTEGFFKPVVINNQLSTTRANLKNVPEKPRFNYKPEMKKYVNKYIEEATEFLIKGCNISPDLLDEKGNRQTGWRTGSKTGPKGYLKDYYPPNGWTGIGLKVASLYDGGSNIWLGNENINGEWYIGYHGVKSIEAIKGICDEGFKRGDGQRFKDSDNINPLTNEHYPKCGEGVYFTNEIEEAKKYTKMIEYNGNQYRIVFMCRVNPYHVRIAKLKENKEYWIVEGDKLGDLRGFKRCDEVRPYRILVLKVKNKNN